MCVDADLLLEREREPFETERYKSTTKERQSAILSVFFDLAGRPMKVLETIDTNLL
jgi:hypothetical protein